MEFREGQPVVLKNNWGNLNNRERDNYYHGGNIREVPLGTKGKVKKIYGPKSIVIDLKNGRTWEVHPDELGLSLEIKTTDSLASLPKHPLIDMIKDSPALVVDEQLYIIQDKQSGNSIVNINKTAQGLSGPIPLSSLDELFFQRAESDLAYWRENYTKEILENIVAPQEIKTSNIPQRIYQEVFPYFINNKQEKLSSILGIASKEQVKENIQLPKISQLERDKLVNFRAEKIKKEVERMRTDLYSQDEEPITKRSRKESLLDNILVEVAQLEKYTPITLIGKAIGQRAVLFNEGNAYSLERVKNISSGTKIPLIVDGRGYSIKSKLSRESLDRDLSKIILDNQIKETFDLNLSLDNIKKFVSKEVEGLPDFAGITEYEGEDGAGFIKNNSNNSWYATLRVPAFAIEDYNGKWYKFDSARVGVKFPDYSSALILVDNNNHPWIHGGKGMFNRICLYENTNLLRMKKSDGETVASWLDIGRKVLLYSPNLLSWVHRDQDDRADFKPNIRKKEDLEKGLLLIPKEYAKEDRRY